MKKTNQSEVNACTAFTFFIKRKSRFLISTGCILFASVFNYGCEGNEPEVSASKSVTLEEKLIKDETFQDYLAVSSEFASVTLEKVGMMNDKERADYIQRLQKLSEEPMNEDDKASLSHTLGFQNDRQFEVLYDKLTLQRNKLLSEHPGLNKLDEGQRKDLFLKMGTKQNIKNIVSRPVSDRALSNMRTNGPNCGTCKPEKDNCRREAGAVYALSIAAGLTGCVVAGPFYKLCVAGVYSAATVVLDSQINKCEINYTRCVNNECN